MNLPLDVAAECADLTMTNKTLDENRVWREGYRAYLISNHISAEIASGLAAKVAFSPNLYPIADLVANTKLSRSCRRTDSHKSLQIETADLIGIELPAGKDLAFMHSIWCHVGLPRSKVDGHEFFRRSGFAWVRLEAGMFDEGNGPVQQQLPYGSMPRLALTLISTYAMRHRTREVPMGNSASDFLSKMGMDDQGGRHAVLRRQMYGLAAFRMQIGYKGRTYSGQPVEQMDAWNPALKKGKKSLWPGVLVLSEAFSKELGDHGAPVDLRAYRSLSKSALALDVYSWLAYRLHRIDGKKIELSRSALKEQFGQEYKGKNSEADFWKKFVPALYAAANVYPKAKIEVLKDSVSLFPSPPPVSGRLGW